jgi:hypothetical protein
VRSLRLGESSRLSINNGRRQASPEGGKGRTERRRSEMKRRGTRRRRRNAGKRLRNTQRERERERERGRVGGTKAISRPFRQHLHGALRVPGEKRKGGRCSGDTCPECVPGTVARKVVREIGAASGQAAFAGECLEITCEVATRLL